MPSCMPWVWRQKGPSTLGGGVVRNVDVTNNRTYFHISMSDASRTTACTIGRNKAIARFPSVYSRLTRQDISKATITDDSRGLRESVVGKIQQRISEVSVKGDSAAAVRIFDGNVDMRGLFSKRLATLFRKHKLAEITLQYHLT